MRGPDQRRADALRSAARRAGLPMSKREARLAVLGRHAVDDRLLARMDGWSCGSPVAPGRRVGWHADPTYVAAAHNVDLERGA